MDRERERETERERERERERREGEGEGKGVRLASFSVIVQVRFVWKTKPAIFFSTDVKE